MPFTLPPLPSFSVQVPDFTAKAAEGAQLRNMLSEMSLRQALAPSQIQTAQAQAQTAQMQAEMQRIQLQGQQALQQWLTQGDTNAEIDPSQFALNDKIATFVGVDPKDPIMQVVRSMAQHGVPAQMLMAEAQQMLQRRTEYNKGTEEQQKIVKDNYDVWKDAMGTIFNASPKEQGPLVAAALPRLAQATHLSPELDSMVSLLRQNPQMGVPIAYNLVAAQDKALGLSKAASEAATAAQGIINPATGMSPTQTSELTKEVAEQPLKLQLTTAEARAREQVQASMLPIMEQVRQTFANQKDARDKIESTVLKPYQDKMTDITQLRSAIDQADQGNPAAARAVLFKLVGVSQPTGSHRVMPQEVKGFSGMRGITDRVAGAVSDILSGDPWTKERSVAIRDFADGQESAAQTSLNTGIDRTNKLYGTNVGRGLQQQVSGATRSPANPGAVPQGATGKARGSDGNWYYHDSKGQILGQVQGQ